MKELSLSMSTNSVEVSVALVTFALVIFLGIVGLFVVVLHRQKRKRQLKALLRAKNLGPILESKAIAQSTGMKYYPKYTVNPDIEALPEEKKVFRRLDINDLLAGIMIRVRKSSQKDLDKSAVDQEKSTETSFYYKESSVSNDEEGNIKDVAVQVHQSAIISDDSLSDGGNSFVSRISQKVFIKEDQPSKNDIKAKLTNFFSSVAMYKHTKHDTKL